MTTPAELLGDIFSRGRGFSSQG